MNEAQKKVVSIAVLVLILSGAALLTYILQHTPSTPVYSANGPIPIDPSQNGSTENTPMARPTSIPTGNPSLPPPR